MHSLAAVLPVLLAFLAGSAQATTCNATNPCPSAFPCCSEFGFCGTDAFCLGGCNPLASNSIDSCRPNPICQDATHTFANFNRILTNATYFNGNASEYDWVVNSGTIMNTNVSGGELAMILTENNGGTRLSSTRYVHYGTITARLKTGRWGGVVTAFITMSDIKDEIDWEFPGAATTEGQTNYFWQGVIPSGPNNGQTTKGLSDTYSNYHDYTIDWQPKTLTFSVDGKVVRTINQADTVDKSGVSRYPNTPSRIQLSIWPAGIASSAPGTVQWGGGMINWQDPDYLAAGHFYALVKSVVVKCGDSAQRTGEVQAYKYGSNATSQTPSIAMTNQTTLLNGAGPTLGSAMSFRGAMATVAGLMIAAHIL
ncbi:putative glycosyl hydrolases family 16 [Lyophyllum shimeji]|uniref:Glycosyl hydrolases family 16 n=1 Tax=Lyophyllum shimeji TaxID=47721 RepID=A0A9P3URI9_LYOSH|nr:putative glycosyl hydrolases family 16 [Lyophyllum shimeji]